MSISTYPLLTPIVSKLLADGDARALTEVLRSGTEAGDRAAAARALGHLRAKTAEADLIIALRDEWVCVRASAIEALGEIRPAAALGLLIDCLQDTETDVAHCAARILGEWGDPIALEPLLGLVGRRKSASGVLDHAQSAENAIESIARRSPDLVREQCRAALVHPDSRTRGFAARMAGKLKDALAVDALVASLDDSTVTGSCSIYDGCQPSYFEMCAVRSVAARSLGEIGDYRATIPLVRVLTDVTRESGERVAAARALGELGDESAADALFESLKDPRVRDHASWALRQLSGPRAQALFPVAEIITGLAGPLETRREAASAASRLCDRRTIPSLIHALADCARELTTQHFDEDWASDRGSEPFPWPTLHELIRRLVDALRSLGGDEAERAIDQYGPTSFVRILKDGSRARWEKERAARALVDLQDARVFDALFEALLDRESSSDALSLLEQIGSPRELRAVARVIAALECGGVDGCSEAVKEAAALRDPRTIPSLVHALDRWIPELIAASAVGLRDAKLVLTLRVMIRSILRTLSIMEGDLARRTVERYGSVLEARLPPNPHGVKGK